MLPGRVTIVGPGDEENWKAFPGFAAQANFIKEKLLKESNVLILDPKELCRQFEGRADGFHLAGGPKQRLYGRGIPPCAIDHRYLV